MKKEIKYNSHVISYDENTQFFNLTNACKSVDKLFKSYNKQDLRRIYDEYIHHKYSIDDMLSNIAQNSNENTWGHWLHLLFISKWNKDHEKVAYPIFKKFISNCIGISIKEIVSIEDEADKYYKKKLKDQRDINRKNKLEEWYRDDNIIQCFKKEIGAWGIIITNLEKSYNKNFIQVIRYKCNIKLMNEIETELSNDEKLYYTYKETIKGTIIHWKVFEKYAVECLDMSEDDKDKYKKLFYEKSNGIINLWNTEIIENNETDVIDRSCTGSSSNITQYNPLVFGDIIINTYPNSKYINLTALIHCKNKAYSFEKWYEKPSNKKFLSLLAKDLGVEEICEYNSSSTISLMTDHLVYKPIKGNNKLKTWGHPRVAIKIATWVSEEFDIICNNWIFKDNDILKKRPTEHTSNKVVNFDNDIKELTPQIEERKSSLNINYKKLYIDGNLIEIDGEGFISGTQLAKMGGKTIQKWIEKETTQKLIEIENLKHPYGCLRITKGRYGGTWIHRRLAYHLAMWISPSYASQVSDWLDEIHLTGKVEVGKEKSNEELEQIYKEKILALENDLSNETEKRIEAENRYQKMLKRQKYPIMNRSKCIYITGDNAPNQYKIGKCNDINDVLSDYRRNHPETILHLVYYTEDKDEMEKYLLKAFKKNLLVPNHEVIIIKDIKIEDIIMKVKSIVELFDIKGEYEEGLDYYNNYIL